MSNTGLATQFAPPFKLVNAHFLFGILGFVVAALFLNYFSPELSGHYLTPKFIGLTHAFVFFWFLPVVFGALLQMLPVLFEVPVRGVKTAGFAFALLAIGGPGVYSHLVNMNTSVGLIATSSFVTLAILLYCSVFFRTLLQAKKIDLTGWHVIAALCCLAFAALAGLVLAFHLHKPFLPYAHTIFLRGHAHLAAFGFFAFLVMGVAYKLTEMFLLAYGAPKTAGKISLSCGTTGVTLLSIGFFWLEPMMGILWAGDLGTILIGLSVILFAVQMRVILSKRMKRKLDAPWQHTIAAVVWLLVAFTLAATMRLGGHSPDVEHGLGIAYGFIGLLGFVGSVIIGQLYKIVPFLVWLHKFSHLLGGDRPVKPATELISKKAMDLLWMPWHLGLLCLVIGVLSGQANAVRAGSLLVLAVAVGLAITLIGVYRATPYQDES
ncbi:MAG: hypothetical protein HN844_10485 [Planctomycetes bacterium]|jgi:hypothetical protein|nr:hypothetical protein [Planctomycetota bacterium]